jgi:hypothetical protein
MVVDTLGQRVATKYGMSREQALQHDPKAEPGPGTCEIRNAPAPDEAQCAGAVQRSQRRE